MNKHLSRRILSLLLTLTMLLALVAPVGAAGSQTELLAYEKIDSAADTSLRLSEETAQQAETLGTVEYAQDDIVRVSIVLEDESTVEHFGEAELLNTASAEAYRDGLKAAQVSTVARIDAALGESIDVVWNLTLAANLISANVRYGQIEQIEKLSGVKRVVIENRYEPMVVDKDEADDPNMSTSSNQIGSNVAWAAGYTGAGSKVAVIDTGIDYEHLSFDAAAWNYSMSLNAAEDETLEEYKARVGVLTKDALTDELLSKLNVKVTADKAYLSDKIPFAYNYVDSNYTVDHVHDTQGEHGSHVEGIAAANRYIPDGNGAFVSALESVLVQGVAPDAQIFTMKVFGAGGGAYDSDYMAAIEDAVVLGADSINLSLGSGNPGFSRSTDYADMLAGLTESGISVVCMSAGNSSYWAENTTFGYLYAEDVSMQMDGSPGSYTHSLAVASVDNDGFTGSSFTANGVTSFYTESDYSNAPLSTIAGEYDYVMLPVGVAGETTDFEGIDVTGKVVFVQRGGLSFYVKAENAAAAGAIATVVYNNQAGTINMDLSDYTKTAPAVSITQADGLAILAASTKAADGDYYTGKITIQAGIGSAYYNSDTYTMSSYSSWGVPGSLELKPEITAPGGSIYSVYGANNDTGMLDHDQYETMSGTSMASPQVAGMAAVVAQYVRETGLVEKTGLSARALINSLLMSTAEPIIDANSSYSTPYSVLNQGAGLANVGNAVSAKSYILVGDNLSGTAYDGKVKAEFGDDPDKTGVYEFDFTIHNLTDEAQEYTFSADLFTQELFTAAYTASDYATFMDTLTTPLMAVVDFDVTGADYTPGADAFVCDVNGDGKTDAKDVQYILDYTTGKVADIADIADLNGNGAVDTNDAYVLLQKLSTASVVVPAADNAVSVHVTVTLTDDQKAALDADYPNGAYVEGYVYVETVTEESEAEGELIVDHSIPMLGFYGNWSDANMIDTSTYVEKLYDATNTGSFKPGYLYEATGATANYFSIKYPGEKTSYAYTVNPYVVENEIPYDRAAINSASTIDKYSFTLVRNAASAVNYFKNETTGETSLRVIQEQVAGAYYYTNGSAWRNTGYSLSANLKPMANGLKEGDVFTAGLVLIPEYYETDGALTEEQALALIESGALGEGAFFTNTFTVDDTAPAVLQISKDLLTGYVTVVAQDNQYVSYIGVYNKTGSKILMGGAPVQDEANEVCGLTFPLDDSAGEYITIVVADYAGNETSYRVKYGGTPEDFTGRMFGFTSGTSRGNGQRWVEIDMQELSSTGGMGDYAEVDYEAYAAEYAGKHVFFATADGFYVADQEEMEKATRVANFAFGSEDEMVADMAFNMKDGKMYVLTNHISNMVNGALATNPTNSKQSKGNHLYTLDLISGELEKVADITITHPRSAQQNANGLTLRAMTIDDEGNFYAVNNGTAVAVRLYKWTLDQITDGAVTVDPVSAEKLISSGLYTSTFVSMAYDHENDVIYLGGGYGKKDSDDVDNELWVVDPVNATVSHPNAELNAQFGDHVVGLYVVPKNTIDLPTDGDITDVILGEHQKSLLKGTTYQLGVTVTPWIAADKSVTWTSSAPEIVSVENGEIKTLAVGEATITATSVADPTLSDSCTITVTALPNIKLSGLVYDTDSKTYWSEFETDDLTAWTKSDENASGSYVAGALHDGELILHDGSNLFSVDPDEFTTTPYGSIASSWIYSDAASAPLTEDGYFGKLVGVCGGGTMIEMLDAKEGDLSYWDLSSYFADDPIAAIAHAGSGTYDYLYIIYMYADCPANFYYVITESGKLYQFTMFTYTEGASYTMLRDEIGDTGLDLSGVSAVTGGKYASMVYDQETGYLLLSSYQEGDTAALYAIHPDELIPAEVGTFGADVWPVVSLYQYERATDLTIKASKTSYELYVKDTAAIETKVVLGDSKELTWATSDANVVTVDNGVITGVGEGTATVTATTVAVNAAGEHVSRDFAVTVKPIEPVNATVNAQVTTEDGSAWVSIDLETMATTKLADADVQIIGGGYAQGAIYGSDIYSEAGSLYRIDPTTFAVTGTTAASTSYAVRDLTDYPLVNFKLTTDGTVYESSYGNFPFYICNSNGARMITDFENGKLSGWNSNSNFPDLAAISYVGSTTVAVVNSLLGDDPITECDEDTTAHIYYVLNLDGVIYQYIVVPIYNVTTQAPSLTLVRGKIAELGVEFDDLFGLSMEYIEFSEDNYGLIVADAITAALYYINLAGETPTFGKIGNMEGATWISCLYNASPKAASPAAVEHMLGLDTSVFNTVHDDGAITASGSIAMSGESESSERVYELLGEAEEVIDEAEEIVEETEETTAFDLLGTAELIDLRIANPVVGTLNAVNGTTEKQSVKPSVGGAAYNKMTVILSDDEAITNAKYTVTYDPAQLSFIGYTSPVAFKSLNNDAEKGIITIALASEQSVEANTVLASLSFACADGVDPCDILVTINGVERNENVAVTGDTRLIGGEHDWDDGVTTEPTCTEAGQTLYTCRDCEETLIIELPALGHDYAETVITEPTCTEKGEKLFTCTRCGDSYTEEIPANGHTFVGGTCIICGLSTGTGGGSRPTTPTKPALPFVDVDEDDSFYDAVKYLYDKGIMLGTSDTTFSPSMTLDRGMVVTILYRLAGEPAVAFKGVFSDITSDIYCAKAVEWAAANGIALGCPDGTFKPYEAVTIEQLAAFLSRYAAFKGIEVYAAELGENANVSDWAKADVAWAVAEGILTAAQAEKATSSANRAEVAVAVYNYITKTAK